MALIKREYTDQETVITAENLNAIQDAVIALEDGLFSVDNDKSGEVITISDAANRGLRSLKIFGKTTQNGTPTPDAPVDLESIGGEGSIIVNVTGENDEQRMTIETPNGLPGIPVDSGGNYTDANGQQWICDEIDFARGVYVRRVGKRIVDGVNNPASKNDVDNLSYLYYIRVADKAQSGHGVCTHFSHFVGYPSSVNHFGNFNVTMAPNIVFFSGYGIVSGDNSTVSSANEFNNWLKAQNEAGTPVTLLYAMATPIETPLPAEEIAAYSKLRTYKDLTTVSNDAYAYMELEYVMDAKKYIDRIVVSGGGGGSSAWLSNVTLLASAWKGADSLFSQVVTIGGITENSKVDLLPSVAQLAIFHNKDVTFVTENDNGVVTVYAIGEKPTQDYTMQVSITEVVA